MATPAKVAVWSTVTLSALNPVTMKDGQYIDLAFRVAVSDDDGNEYVREFDGELHLQDGLVTLVTDLDAETQTYNEWMEG